MSSTASSSANFQSVLNAAFESYTKKTGIDLINHPSAHKLENCNTSEDILQLFQERETAFKDYRNKNRKLINRLRPVVQVVHAFSGVISKVAGTVPFQPTKAIFVGVDILLVAAIRVSASYDALIDLFECVGNFLRRLHIYIEKSPLSPAMSDIIVKIMTEVLGVIAVATKKIEQGRFTMFARKLLGENEIEAILQRLDRLTHEEVRVTAAHTLEVVHGLVKNLKVIIDDGKASSEDIRRALAEMQEMTDEINKIKRDQLQEKIRSWLLHPDPSTNHNIALEQHHNGTASWFTQGDTFKEWRAKGSLLWINGKPGSGKSVLCSSIIQEVEGSHNMGLALMTYFYFDFRDPKKQDVSGLLASLLAQLSAKSDPCYHVLSALYSKYDAGSRQPSNDALTECLKDILKMRGQPPIYIIVDAIDECPSGFGVVSPRDRVLELLEKLIGLRLPNVRICLTSRPEVDIRASLESLSSHTVSLHDQLGQKNDVMDYVNYIVHSDRNMRKWRTEDKRLVTETLSRKADGMFRWIVCQLAMLRRCLPAAIRCVLEDLPESLDETYERILLSIGQERRDYAQRLFQCLAVSIRPLRIDEVADILAIIFDPGTIPIYDVTLRPQDPEEAVLSTCSSLIMIVNANESLVVQFSHFSVKEYLTSERLAKSGKEHSRYHIRPVSSHTILAQSSLSILLTLDDQVDKSSMKDFPLAIYAAQHWVEHAQFENVSLTIMDAIEPLFDPTKSQFATWVWIYDIDHPFREIMSEAHPTRPEAVPLYYATLCGFGGVVERLVTTCPSDVNAKGGYYRTPLHAAIWKGNIEMVRLLLAHQADVTALNDKGLTPFHLASRRGHPAIVELLLKFYADIDIRDGKGKTSLKLASELGRLDVARLLVENGANVDSCDRNGSTPLMAASGDGHTEVMRFLLQCGAAVDSRDKDGWTALTAASAKGYGDVVRWLLDGGAMVDSVRNDGWTALMSAATGGYADVVRLLLRGGASVDPRDKNGSTPLMAASANGHADVVRSLLEGGADVDCHRNDGSTSLILASYNGCLNVVCLLLEGGAAVESRDNDSWSAVMAASSKGRTDVVRQLLDSGAPVDFPDNDDSTPLMSASLNGHADVAHLLLEGGAAVNSRHKNGLTPLIVASMSGHEGVVRLLLRYGAAVDSRDNDAWTPLTAASANGHLNVVRMLIEGGAVVNSHHKDSITPTDDVNQQEFTFLTPRHLASGKKHHNVAKLLIEHRPDLMVFNGNQNQETPLGLASYFGKFEVVQLLLESGSNPNTQNSEGWTPLHNAALRGRLEIVKLLIDFGAEVNTRNCANDTASDVASRCGMREVAMFLAMYMGGVDSQTAISRARSITTSQKPATPDATQSSLGQGDGKITDSETATLLHKASGEGNLVMVQSLLTDGAEVNQRDEFHLTPLHLASSRGRCGVAMLLIKHGADVSSRDKFGWTPLHSASRSGHLDMARLLLDHGADVNETKQDKWTPLHLASLFRQVDVVRLLLERGANVHVRNEDDLTPHTIASWTASRETVQLLLEYGARTV